MMQIFYFEEKRSKQQGIVALDQLGDVSARRVRLEDIPVNYIKSFSRPEASPELVEKVRSVLSRAREIAHRAAAEKLKSARRTKDGHVADVAGWAHLVVDDSHSPFVSALLQLGETHTSPETGYYISGIGGLGYGNEQALSLAEAAVEAAKSVFERHFPDVSFGIYTRWD